MPLKKEKKGIRILIELNKKLREIKEVKFFLEDKKHIKKLVLIDTKNNYRTFIWFSDRTNEDAFEQLTKQYAFFRRDNSLKIPVWMDQKYFNIGHVL